MLSILLILMRCDMSEEFVEDMPGFRVPTPEELSPFFHGYEIHGILGYGGMGAVYKAHQTFFNRDVAIKVLLCKTFGEEEFQKQFLAETQSMSVLEHEHLLKIYDYGELDGMLYIIMEYVHGCSLQEGIGVHGVDPLQTAQIMMRVCEGLSCAHEADIIHRDLKPENILIDEYANPKIADFGLARDVDNNEADKVIFGSPGYVSPEATQPPYEVDQRSDIYSLGCVYYHMITGRIPDPAAMDYETFEGLVPAFHYILNRSMNPIPANRYASAADMGEAFRDLILSLDEKGSNGVISYDPGI